MGGFNPPVPQQDSNWEIRAAVLLSLFFQMVLIFLGPTRKRSSAPLFRLTVWSCYLLADWVADLALGLLLNNMGNIGGGGGGSGGGGNNGSSSPIIFTFWTPFLLLHLGGPDTITAYSVEDNELWNRHLIGLLFELFSTSVIIFCTLRGNPLVLGTMLVLVAGVIKYGERTYSLYSGSAESLRESILGPPESNYSWSKLMTEFRAKKRAGLPVELHIYDTQEADRLELWTRMYRHTSLAPRAYELFLTFRCLLVDVIISSKERRLSQVLFLERTTGEAFEVMEMELNFMYDMVYTKAPVAYHRKGWGWVLRGVCSCCLVSALLIFVFHDKKSIQPVDVGITYALLLGGLALDATALLMIFFSDHAKVYLEESPRLAWLKRLRVATKRWRTRRWSGTISQMNLIGYCQEKPGRPYSSSNKCGKWWLMIVKMLGIEEIVDDFFFIRRVSLLKKDSEEEDLRLLDFIFDGLKGSAEKLHKKEEIMQMCSRRGKGVVDRLEKDIKDMLHKAEEDNKETADTKFQLIMESVTDKDFDESLLLWHIATDLCRYPDRIGPWTKETPRFRAIAKTLSEYMLYLLVKQPDMLSATAGIGLRPYRDTCTEARELFAYKEGINREDDMRIFLLMTSHSSSAEIRLASVKGGRSKSVLFDAVILAKALGELDEALMWELVTGVWCEMLMFAAVSGRGRTHVRSLNRGGELITFVWLLMQHMGLSDMYEIQQEDRAQLIVHY